MRAVRRRLHRWGSLGSGVLRLRKLVGRSGDAECEMREEKKRSSGGKTINYMVLNRPGTKLEVHCTRSLVVGAWRACDTAGLRMSKAYAGLDDGVALGTAA